MKLLKRYCQVHPKTRNNLIHFITQTKPLSQTLHERAITQKDQLMQLNEGLQLDLDNLLIVKERQRTSPEPENMLEQIPSEFWRHQCFVQLPANSSYRRKLCVKLVNGDHRKNCIRTHFHLEWSNMHMQELWPSIRMVPPMCHSGHTCTAFNLIFIIVTLTIALQEIGTLNVLFANKFYKLVNSILFYLHSEVNSEVYELGQILTDFGFSGVIRELRLQEFSQKIWKDL